MINRAGGNRKAKDLPSQSFILGSIDLSQWRKVAKNG